MPARDTASGPRTRRRRRRLLLLPGAGGCPGGCLREEERREDPSSSTSPRPRRRSSSRWTARSRRRSSRSGCATETGAWGLSLSLATIALPWPWLTCWLRGAGARWHSMVATFNQTHTVGDIRSYINACVVTRSLPLGLGLPLTPVLTPPRARSSRPGEASAPYVLQTTFPTQDLTDDAATLRDAGLLGSVVVQRPA